MDKYVFQDRGSAVALPHGQGEQGVFAFRPHGVQILTGRAQPTQLHAIHHGESRIKQPARINAFGRAPTNVECGIGIMQLAVGEILVRRVVRIDRFGTQCGKHVHLKRSACVHRHDFAPHIGDQRARLTYHIGQNVFRFGIIDLVQCGSEQTLLAADVVQYSGFGESYAIGDFLQGSAVIAERPKQLDGRVEDLRFPVDFFVGQVNSLFCPS